MRRLLLVPAVLLAVGSIAACGGGDASPGTTKAGYDVTIAGYAFAPTPLTVTPGQVVKVDNLDQAVHDVTSDTAGLFETTALTQNSAATFTAPKTPGTYTFGCSFHPDMHGTLIVKG